MATNRPARPSFITDSFWRTLKDWQKVFVAFLAASLDEEYTTIEIKRHTGLSRLLSARIDPLRVRFNSEVSGYRLEARAEEQPQRVLWKITKR